MFQLLLFCHSIVRWLLLSALLLAIFTAWRGYSDGRIFSKTNNAIRHWTATIAHIQLVLGITLYSQSAMVRYFWQNTRTAIHNREAAFFGVIHIVVMLIAIVLITIGSAMAKRRLADKDKFGIQLLWYGIALVLIFCAIPWPFSPLTVRPYLR